jgi:hypothetical protein
MVKEHDNTVQKLGLNFNEGFGRKEV